MQQDPLLPVVAPRTDTRLILVLFLAGAALILLLANLAGSSATFELIQNAQPTFLLGVLVAQAMRYMASAGSTETLAKTFDRRLPFFPLYQAMLAGQALNRTVSIGGAAGMFVRYSFLTRQSLHSGAVAALFVVEDILGIVTISSVFVVGIIIVLATQTLPQLAGFVTVTFFVGGILAILALLRLYRRRDLVERIVQAAGRIVGEIVVRLSGKRIYESEHVQRAVNEFYEAMAHARRDPARVVGALLYNFLRLGLDAASLYLAFWAVGFAIAPGILLIIFTSSSALSTLSGIPGELGVMETTLAMLSTSQGISASTAISAIVLFRVASYWLPIPLGYLAFWHLQRRGFI